jgi:hypothetical protein
MKLNSLINSRFKQAGLSVVASFLLFNLVTLASAPFVLAQSNGAATVTPVMSAQQPKSPVYAKVLSVERSCSDPNAIYGQVETNNSPKDGGIGFSFQISGVGPDKQGAAAGFYDLTTGTTRYITTQFTGINKPATLPYNQSLTVLWSWSFGLEEGGYGNLTLNSLPNCANKAPSTATISAMAVTSNSLGYWLVNNSGQVFPFGNAKYYGDAPAGAGTIVAMAATPNDGGYWLLDAGGRVFGLGNAAATNAPKPVGYTDVAIATDLTSTASGGKYHAYWVASNTGHMFALGGAPYYGSPISHHVKLREPVTAIAATSDGKGYWFISESAGIYGYGDATLHGLNSKTQKLMGSYVGIAPTQNDQGYWIASFLVATRGVSTIGSNVNDLGNAQNFGSAYYLSSWPETVGIEAMNNGEGYWIVTQTGVLSFGSAATYNLR